MPNPYPDPFLHLRLDTLAQALQRLTNNRAVILDLGSGNRSMDDVISMEFVPWPTNDVQGDVLSLPFRDDCTDLVLSQAVLEHVHYPDQAMQEMFRVLRPGGILYVEAAFMQPVHMAPWHYFNITPHGLTWLLRDWNIIEQGILGTFQQVLDELYREFGQRAPKVKSRAIASIAYGVYATAQKPV